MRAEACVRFSNKSPHDLPILLTRRCVTICFIWSTESFVVGILYKDKHNLIPDESQSFLDGYVLDSVGIKHA